jgi:hypothetical protein
MTRGTQARLRRLEDATAPDADDIIPTIEIDPEPLVFPSHEALMAWTRAREREDRLRRRTLTQRPVERVVVRIVSIAGR